MRKNLVIIKIGGSVITDKSTARGKFKKNTFAKIAREIQETKSKKNFDLILIHGAGAYPHYLTSKYKVSQGFSGPESAFGFVHIKQEVFRLNNLIWVELFKTGMPVSTVQPSAIIFTSKGKIKSFNTKYIEELLKLGITPLLMGDDTIDTTMGINVFSGDTILSYLGKKYKANKLIFISDTEGVFDKNPKTHRNAKLIKEINSKNFDSITKSMEKFNVYDSTGEMAGKLNAINKYLKGFEIIITGEEGIKKVLLGKKAGTLIKL